MEQNETEFGRSLGASFLFQPKIQESYDNTVDENLDVYVCVRARVFVCVYLVDDQQERGRRGFLTLRSARRMRRRQSEGRFPALRRARNRSMESPWRQTSPYLYSPRYFPMKLRCCSFVPVPAKAPTSLSFLHPCLEDRSSPSSFRDIRLFSTLILTHLSKTIPVPQLKDSRIFTYQTNNIGPRVSM